MKKVLILFGKKRKDYLCGGLKAKKNNEIMFEIGKEMGVKYYRASISRYKKGVFKEAWTFDSRKWNKEKNVKPDIIFNKSPYKPSENKLKEEIASKFTFSNDLMFDQIGNNKFLSYLIFKEWMSKTIIVYSQNQLNKSLSLLRTSKVVIKRNTGSGGKNIFIVDNRNINKIKIIDFPVIIQEFIDSSFGIKGLAGGVHDLRIMFINHKPILSYLTKPLKGYVVNSSDASEKKLVPLNKLPKKLKKELKNITFKLSYFNNLFYSIDFFFDKKQKFYIIEINPSPNMRLEDDSIKRKYYKMLSEYFLSIECSK